MTTEWKALLDWEERNDARVLVVLDPESVREDLSYFVQFDADNPESDSFVRDINQVPESLIIDAINHAADEYRFAWSTEDINEVMAEYIVENLSSKTMLHKGNFYDDVTQRFYKWDDLQELYATRKVESVMNKQMEFSFTGEK